LQLNTFIRGASGTGQVKKASGAGGVSTESPIGREQDITIWARPDTSNTTIVDVAIRFNEAF